VRAGSASASVSVSMTTPEVAKKRQRRDDEVGVESVRETGSSPMKQRKRKKKLKKKKTNASNAAAADDDDDADDADDANETRRNAATTATATTTGDHDGSGLSTSALTSLDEGMKRAVKQNRKRARDAQTLLKRAMKVKDVKFFNRLIKDFGNDKQYGFAKEAFERVPKAGLTPNVYSYTNMLNAAVRVGEMDEMRRIWESMADAGVEANEVTYTVLVKGEAQNGNISRARSIMGEMIDSGVEPNQRTYTTLLRNCVRYGDVDNAKRCLETMEERNVAPDATACEYYIKTMCGELMVQQTMAFIRDIKRDGIEPTAQSYVALASAASLVMPDAEIASNSCKDARATLEVDASNADSAQRYGGEDAIAEEEGDPDAPSKSVQLFLQLRAQDAEKEIEAVESYMRDVPLGKRLEIAEKASKGVESAPNVVFVPDEDVSEADRESSWRERFGKEQDVRVEICSGHGDWITRRAKLDRKVQWIGVEMRRNRVALTWMKALRSGVERNLSLMCGMAHDALSRQIPNASVSEVYVNYPDPPEWVGSSQVLVDAAFLEDAHRVLKPDGFLICVTDDSTYAMRMCRELAKASRLFAPTAGNGTLPFESGVPEDYGASYFDSMWTLGNQRDRYFMKYAKM
jgi:pentatricopeptide repeat protein